MGIKRGVSLYSYQQSDFFRTMTWKDMLREIATNLGGATGVEIVSEATVPHYPFPPESFYFDWNNEMARWGLTAVTMDNYVDTLQFRDHVMTPAETAHRIKYDLRIAKKMGFQNLRLVHSIPFESIEMALPLAEELGVRMTNEIHAPQTIVPDISKGSIGTRVAEDIAFIQRTGTKYYGLQPDFSIFTIKPSRVQVTYELRSFMSADAANQVFDELMQMREEEGVTAMVEYFKKTYPDICEKSKFALMMVSQEPSAKPEDLFSIAPYIFCIHGKFSQMTEIEGKPGQYEDVSIDYENPINVLKSIGYDGYINSEYEGQRNQQDLEHEPLPDEIEEVRRQHEMMKRLIGE